MALNMNDYKDEFSGTGVDNKEPVKPEDEFFHAVYIGHSSRKNHLGIIEEAGKFHIRGVQYNMDSVNMIVTLTKKILSKSVEVNKKDKIECFSFQDGPLPHKGSSGNVCGMNANERALNPYCEPCRAQLIVVGILCDESGNPFKTEEGKPVFGFIRGKGMRYVGVSDHLNTLTKLELNPIVQPVTEESKEWEKKHINQCRVVTKITRDIATSSFNSTVNIFKFEVGTQIPDDAVEKIMQITKSIVEKFKEKFDWSKTRAAQTAAAANSYAGAGPTQAQQFGVPDQAPKTQESQLNKPADDIPFGGNSVPEAQPQNQSVEQSPPAEKQAPPAQTGFGFDDLNF